MSRITETNLNFNATTYNTDLTAAQSAQQINVAAQQTVEIQNTPANLGEGIAVRNGITASSEVLVARANSNSEIDRTVNNIVGRPVGVAVSELNNALKNKPADYQAQVINRLVQRDPETAARVLGAAGNSNNRTVAGAFSHAYNSHGQNGDNFLYNIIKNGIGTNMGSAGIRATGVGNLASISGNQSMMREFAEKALVYGHQLRGGGTPQGQAIASGLVNGALQAAGGNGTVLNGVIGKLNSADIKDAVQSGNPALGRALDTAARNNFGTNLFFAAANHAGRSSNVDAALTRYIEKHGVGVLDAATDARGNNAAEQSALKNYIQNVALRDQQSSDNFMKNVFGKILTNSQNRVARTATSPAGIADPANNSVAGAEARRVGTLINLIQKSGGDITAGKEAVSGWLATTLDFAGGAIGEIPFPGAGPLGNAISTYGAKAASDYVNGSAANTDGRADIRDTMLGLDVIQDNIRERIQQDVRAGRRPPLNERENAALNALRQQLDKFGNEVAGYIKIN